MIEKLCKKNNTYTNEDHSTKKLNSGYATFAAYPEFFNGAGFIFLLFIHLMCPAAE